MVVGVELLELAVFANEAKASKMLPESPEPAGLAGSTDALGGEPGGVVDLKCFSLIRAISSGRNVSARSQMSTSLPIFVF